ncbi:MAG: 30S ribosomal protein S16 [Patescibacteria group bacterium]
MLTIRLQRVGRKNNPAFRMIVTDSQNGPKSGRFKEIIGSYDPRRPRSEAQIKKDRVLYWLSVGAQKSDTVHNLLVSLQIISGPKINILPKTKPVTKEKEADKDKTEVKTETETTTVKDKENEAVDAENLAETENNQEELEEKEVTSV